MMHLDPHNKTLQKIVLRDLEIAILDQPVDGIKSRALDFDSYFRIHCPQKNRLTVSFNNPACKDLAPHYLEHFKSQFPRAQQLQADGYELTFTYHLEDQLKTLQKLQGQQAKLQLKRIINSLALRFSRFRTAFLAAPYEVSIAKFLAGQKCRNQSWSQRAGQRNWLVSDRWNFGDKFQRRLARQIVEEMSQAKKHVQDSPSVQLIPCEPLPTVLSTNFSAFPEKNFSIGLVQITLTKKSPLLSNPQKVGELLSNFRRFVSYHIQANKMYLHGRVLNRINDLDRALKFAKFEDQKLQYINTK